MLEWTAPLALGSTVLGRKVPSSHDLCGRRMVSERRRRRRCAVDQDVSYSCCWVLRTNRISRTPAVLRGTQHICVCVLPRICSNNCTIFHTRLDLLGSRRARVTVLCAAATCVGKNVSPRQCVDCVLLWSVHNVVLSLVAPPGPNPDQSSWHAKDYVPGTQFDARTDHPRSSIVIDIGHPGKVESFVRSNATATGLENAACT